MPSGGERERVSCGNGGKRQPCGLFAEGAPAVGSYLGTFAVRSTDPQLSTETSRATGREHRDD